MGQPLADCDFNLAALHPAYPIKRRTSAERTQASPVRRHPEESPALDPLENSIRPNSPPPPAFRFAKESAIPGRSFRTGRRGRACAMSYLAYVLGPRGIRVHAISLSPLKTRAAVRLKDFRAPDE